MEGMGLKFTPVVVRHLLGLLSMFGPTWTQASPNTSNGRLGVHMSYICIEY